MKGILKKIYYGINFFLPPFLMTIITDLVLLIRKPNTWNITTTNYKKEHNSLIILGNGPSLNESIERLSIVCNNYDCMAVNGFANTEYYELLKPNMYVLADTVFFLERDKLSERVRNTVNSIESNLLNKTDWNIALFVPNYGRSSELIKNVCKNKHIRIYFFSMHDHFIPLGRRMKYFLWDRNWIALAGKTVLNTCVNLGIILRYSDIFLVGADTSWHEQLRIDQDNNKLYTIDRHFYGENKIYIYADSYSKVPERLDRELITVSQALSSYWELKDYADTRDVHIYNASGYSDIDAFERRKL